MLVQRSVQASFRLLNWWCTTRRNRSRAKSAKARNVRAALSTNQQRSAAFVYLPPQQHSMHVRNTATPIPTAAGRTCLDLRVPGAGRSYISRVHTCQHVSHTGIFAVDALAAFRGGCGGKSWYPGQCWRKCQGRGQSEGVSASRYVELCVVLGG